MPTYRVGFANPLEELRDEFDRLWESFSSAPPLLRDLGIRPRGDVFPALNVSESDDCVTVEAELPGILSADIDISVTGDELVLKGTRPDAEAGTTPAGAGNGGPKPSVTWHRRERGTGAFERRLTLPVAVDAQRVEARLVDGVLTVTCPKAAQCQPHKVKVQPA